jgi:hypothetical protein
VSNEWCCNVKQAPAGQSVPSHASFSVQLDKSYAILLLIQFIDFLTHQMAAEIISFLFFTCWECSYCLHWTIQERSWSFNCNGDNDESSGNLDKIYTVSVLLTIGCGTKAMGAWFYSCFILFSVVVVRRVESFRGYTWQWVRITRGLLSGLTWCVWRFEILNTLKCVFGMKHIFGVTTNLNRYAILRLLTITIDIPFHAPMCCRSDWCWHEGRRYSCWITM